MAGASRFDLRPINRGGEILRAGMGQNILNHPMPAERSKRAGKAFGSMQQVLALGAIINGNQEALVDRSCRTRDEICRRKVHFENLSLVQLQIDLPAIGRDFRIELALTPYEFIVLIQTDAEFSRRTLVAYHAVHRKRVKQFIREDDPGERRWQFDKLLKLDPV